MAAEEEPSRAAGGCVLVVLAGVATALAFAVDEAVGVLAVVLAAWAALYRSARRMSDSPATPPPRGVAPESEEAARRRLTKARGVQDPNGVMCIIHPVQEEVTGE
ncbi:hypothetical protein [Streptomyces soliscabiei]|uniref:hypothetical protein n=1 Tax=Streptomyces soliscabiei TaxID=588897 RepID=UPI0029A32EE6|nr:hypothetical protein [Streptomyces sp. NY05-11A]MDX2679280.1 hypothetical protein [Streptomyces sp. NY05-11A]